MTYQNEFSYKITCHTWEICSLRFKWQDVIIGSGNGLVPNRHQAITWNNDDQIHWWISFISWAQCVKLTDWPTQMTLLLWNQFHKECIPMTWSLITRTNLLWQFFQNRAIKYCNDCHQWQTQDINKITYFDICMHVYTFYDTFSSLALII